MACVNKYKNNICVNNIYNNPQLFYIKKLFIFDFYVNIAITFSF